MILSDLVLTSRANQQWLYSGMDSPDLCVDKKHFRAYAFPVSYDYNSRGFRDQEWPASHQDLQQSIWCVGDSFTVGIGQPLEHTWPYVLQNLTGRRTINVSLDGASNNWIARRTKDILQKVAPNNVCIMWSYVERRELTESQMKQLTWQRIYDECKDSSWPTCPKLHDISSLPMHIRTELIELHRIPLDAETFEVKLTVPDEDRRTQNVDATAEENFWNWCRCVDSVCDYQGIIHAMIPKFSLHPKKYLDYLTGKGVCCLGVCDQLDKARDGHHFGLATSGMLAQQVAALIQSR